MLKAHIICHTHWDREWYLTRTQFRTKLVRLIDNLLEIVDNSPDFVTFMMDGQTIVLEDYLEIRPENRDRLTDAIRRGKIVIGPWYILPDEMLISGESHIRNFLIGDRAASEFGPKMNVGYLPDSFGHPEQMPQILNGLGLDTIVFWRGVPNSIEKTEFDWVGSDGESRVLCVNMPYGYGTAARLKGSMDEIISRLDQMMDKLAALSNGKVILLMNGSDHLLADERLPEIVSAFNTAVEDKQIAFTTMQDFLDNLRSQLPGDLETHKGNIYSGDRTILLGGTLSTRMYLKQLNHNVQKGMERYAEPMLAIEKLLGGDFDSQGYQNYLWKKILENHPHDSICGCSIDEVHDEMVPRFNSVLQMEEQVLTDCFERLEGSLPEYDKLPDAQILCFEPTQDRLPSYQEVLVDFDVTLKKRVDFSKSIIEEYDSIVLPPAVKTVKVFDQKGRLIPSTVVEGGEDTAYKYSDDGLPEVYAVNQCKLGLMLPAMDYGLHTLYVYKSDEDSGIIQPRQQNRIENRFYKMTFDEKDGTFTVLDKKSGRVLPGINKFIDKGDAGDEYTYAWPDRDTQYTLDANDISSVETVFSGFFKQSIQVKGSLKLPKGLTDDRKSRSTDRCDNPVQVTASLYQDSDQIDFEVTLTNSARDHRLQVSFPAGTLCTQSAASTAFAVTVNEIEKEIPAVWEEYPQRTALTHGFVDASSEEYGITLASGGMTEYEVVNNDGMSNVNLTLLRCVGWLSRGDLNTRKGDAGWTIMTPGAQCQGTYCYSYSLTYHEGTWQKANTFAAADRKLHPVRLQQLKKREVPISIAHNPAAFVSSLPGLFRISAFKPAEKRQSVILRFYSLDPVEKEAILKMPGAVREAYLVDCKETRQKRLHMEEGTINLSAEFGKIISIELVY